MIPPRRCIPAVLLSTLLAVAACDGAADPSGTSPADRAAGGGKADGFGLTCADLAGQCLTSLHFPTSAPSCESEYGLITASEGACEVLNESCCVAPTTPPPPPPPPPPACESAGGTCLGSVFFPTSAPSCEWEYGMVTVDAACGSLAESCCATPPPLTCAEAEGECRTSLGDDPPGCGSLLPIDGACPQSNQSCCEQTVQPF